MTLPSSGPISATQIIVEERIQISDSFDMNSAVSRDLADKPSGQIAFSDFYSKTLIVPGCYDVPPGTDTWWTVPHFRNSLTVQVWGGGGRGGAYGSYTGSSASDGRYSPSGGTSIFDRLVAYGGQGGQNGGTDRNGGLATGAGGAGGTASGGDVNVTGGAGQTGPGAGGVSWGTGGSYYPGGGGTGYVANTGKFPGNPGGAGAGGYTQKYYTRATITPGSVVHIVCGLAGAPATGTNGTGYAGQNGKVYICWDMPVAFPVPPPAYGTYLGQICANYNLYNQYADGSNGTFLTVVEYNSATCGYTGDFVPWWLDHG